jgi:uncharacterized membrane protein
MLGFFENLISFGVKVSLVSSGVFGLHHFMLSTIRGFFIVFPIYFILQEEYEYNEYQKKKKKITKKAKKQLKKQNPGQEIDQDQLRKVIKKKIKRIPHKSYFMFKSQQSSTLSKIFNNSLSSNAKSKGKILTHKNSQNKLSIFARQKTIVRNTKFKIRLSSIGDLEKPASILQWVLRFKII